MHSPDFRMSNEDMRRHQNTVLQLAESLKHHIPELKDLEKEIKQVDRKLLLLLVVAVIL